MKCIFGVDIGGTNIKFGKFVEEKLVEKSFVKTLIDEDPMVIIKQIEEEVKAKLGDDELIGIGVGVPGPVIDGVNLGAQNIKWRTAVDVKGILSEIFPGIAIRILNDANAATLGEWNYSNDDHLPNVVFITLGTGIGGGIVINNKLIEGAHGSCGELGHIKLFPFGGRPCTCGLEGCLEQYASATGIVRTAYGMINNGDTVLKQKRRLNSKDIFDAALEGDKIANDIVDKSAYYLAMGIANICNVLNPNRVIIGGGVSKAGDFFLDKVKVYFNQMAFFSIKDTQIVLASLYNDAGIYGCFYSVREMLNEY